jgi:uncharacterized lipoprotein YmbA
MSARSSRFRRSARSFSLGPLLALSLLLLLLFAACSFFSQSKNNFYALDPVSPTGPVVTMHGVAVGIGGIELPPGLDRRELVVRKADQQLDVRSTEQWAASLQPLVLHALAVDLARRLPEGTVILPGEAKPAGGVRSIDVVFEELAAGPDAKITVDASWVVHELVRDGSRPEVSHHEHFTVDTGTLDSAKIATGMSQAIAVLADRIAAQL